MPPQRNPNFVNRQQTMQGRPPNNMPYSPYKFQSNTTLHNQHNQKKPNQSFSSQTNRQPPNMPKYGRHTNLQRMQAPPQNMHHARNKANTVANPRFVKSNSNPLKMNNQLNRGNPKFQKMRSTGKNQQQVNNLKANIGHRNGQYPNMRMQRPPVPGNTQYYSKNN